MEVTKKNYSQEINNLLALLPHTKFLSIDLEFTGLPREQNLVTDTPMEVYYKAMTAANYNNIIQFGITLFTESQSQSAKNNAHSFSFYIFPDSYYGKVNQKMTLDVSSIEFNRDSGGVDFGIWFTQGVPYYNKKLQVQLKKCFENDRTIDINSVFKEAVEPKNEVQINLEKPVISEYKNNITIFNEDERKSTLEELSKFKDWTVQFEVGKTFEFISNKGIIRQYFWNEVKNSYTHQLANVIIEEKDGEKSSIRFSMSTKAQKQDFMKQLTLDLEEKYRRQLGLSQHWETIKELIKVHQIPAVFHQGNLDLMFIISHLENWVPLNFAEYKKTVHNCFPILYDTKNLSRLVPKITGGHLEGIYTDLSKIGKFDPLAKYPIVNQDPTQKNKVAHNAGWDSYMTGVTFSEIRELMKGNITHSLNQVSIFKNKFFNLSFGNQENYLLEGFGLIFISNDQKDGSKIVTKGVSEGRKYKVNRKEDGSRDKLKQALVAYLPETIGEAGFSINRHTELEVIGNNVFYFVTFDKVLLENQVAEIQEKFKEQFDVKKVKEYYTSVLESFEQAIYQSK